MEVEVEVEVGVGVGVGTGGVRVGEVAGGKGQGRVTRESGHLGSGSAAILLGIRFIILPVSQKSGRCEGVIMVGTGTGTETETTCIRPEYGPYRASLHEVREEDLLRESCDAYAPCRYECPCTSGQAHVVYIP